MKENHLRQTRSQIQSISMEDILRQVASYALHTSDLLLSTAHFLKRMKLPEYPNGYEAFDDTRFAQFASGFFTDIRVSGRLPLFGDSASDTGISDDGKIFDKGTLTAEKKRTRIIFENARTTDFRPGDSFEIRLLAPGDTFEVPVWSQAKLQENGRWQVKSPARVKITD